MNKVIVFGGSGFLGSHVADALTDNGYDVTIFDTIESPWLRDSQKMVIGDILDFNSLNTLLENVFAVYNFAAIADLNEAIDKPIETVKINILGNVNILEACKNNNVKKFIYASSVYVNSREGGFYKCSKNASEDYVVEYSLKYGLEYTILRYGSLYGPRSDDHNGLFRIVKKALDSNKIIYSGSKETIRQYIHVQDAAKASVKALDNEYNNEILILSGQESMKVYDVLKMLAEILGDNYTVEFNDDHQIGHYIRSPYALKNNIGKKFIPNKYTDLGQGLLELINNINNNEKTI